VGKLLPRKKGHPTRRRTGKVEGPGGSEPPGCTVLKSPSPISAGFYTTDIPGTLGGTLNGGDILGEAGCPVVRHEIIVLANGGGPPPATPVPITVVDSWNQVVLTSAAISRSITISTALSGFLGDPGVVEVWLRSYTAGDFSYREDYCVTTLVPGV